MEALSSIPGELTTNKHALFLVHPMEERSMRDMMRRPKNASDGQVENSFQNFASSASRVVGSKWAFFAAMLLIVSWGIGFD
jgi:hypothetical protein